MVAAIGTAIAAASLAMASQRTFPDQLPALAPGVEAISLRGTSLMRPDPSPDSRARLEADLARAREDYVRNPKSVDAAVWVGRRLAYLGRFREAIRHYSDALERFGAEPRLLRHRGHRYLTVRLIGPAIADFEMAGRLIIGKPDEIEQDGIPNARNQPISSLHSNIWYHLALARYLTGEWEPALRACDRGMKVSGNPDRMASQTYWRYLVLRRLDKEQEARQALNPIRADLDVVENHAYLRLLLVFRGDLEPGAALDLGTGANDEPTTAFGLGAHLLANGDRVRARALFERATAGRSWPAFGFLAAEAELARMSDEP